MVGFVRMWLAKTAAAAYRAIRGTAGPWRVELAGLRSVVTALPSDLERASFLRTYCGGLIPLGLIDPKRLDPRTSRLYRSTDFAAFDPAAFFPLFKNQVIPAECGITSYFYIKLLHSLGFKAYQYTFGFKGAPHQRCVHSVVLVEIQCARDKRLIVQDPYLNLTYRDYEGNPLDFLEFVSRIKRSEYDRIVMDSSPVTTSLLVPDLTLYDPHLNEEYKRLILTALRGPDGQVKTKLNITRDYATLMQSPVDNLEEAFLAALRDHGHREPYLYAYMFRASDLVGAADHKLVQRKIDAALSAWEPSSNSSSRYIHQ
jgi:hypothetical protein